MENLENQITLQSLERAKPNLVPHVFSENYFRILRLKLENKELTYNERYYYNHFIKKKLKGALELFALEDFNIHGKQFMLAERIKKATALLKKYSQKHKGMKILISGSFLFKEKYNDIDVFILSKYNKEDYKDGKVHVNYLPLDVQSTLFFKSISKISMTNFRIEQIEITEKISIEDFFQLYEYLILLIMQKDDYLIELRDFLLKAEYLSSKTILNSMQLKLLTERIMKYKKPIQIINKYLVAKTFSMYSPQIIKRKLRQFIKKNSVPEKGKAVYPNWKIYNKTYEEVLNIVA